MELCRWSEKCVLLYLLRAPLLPLLRVRVSQGPAVVVVVPATPIARTASCRFLPRPPLLPLLRSCRVCAAASAPGYTGSPVTKAKKINK